MSTKLSSKKKKVLRTFFFYKFPPLIIFNRILLSAHLSYWPKDVQIRNARTAIRIEKYAAQAAPAISFCIFLRPRNALKGFLFGFLYNSS